MGANENYEKVKADVADAPNTASAPSRPATQQDHGNRVPLPKPGSQMTGMEYMMHINRASKGLF